MIRILSLSFECDDLPRRLLRSQWQSGDQCLAYVHYRRLIALFYIFSCVFSLFYASSISQLVVKFVYLTYLNMFATMISTSLGSLLVTAYYKGILNDSKETTWLLKVYWFVSNSVVIFSCGISFNYWMFLYRGQDNDLSNWLVHATNCIFLIFDLFIVDYPHRLSHALHLMVCGTLYLLFSFVYPALGGLNKDGDNFIYPILDWNRSPKQAAAHGVGNIIALGLLHVLVGFIHRARRWIHTKTSSIASNENNQILNSLLDTWSNSSEFNLSSD